MCVFLSAKYRYFSLPYVSYRNLDKYLLFHKYEIATAEIYTQFFL